jgi:Flp pilus assembly protein TadB
MPSRTYISRDYYYYSDKLTNRMSQLQVNQVNKKKKKQNNQTTKQSIRINRTRDEKTAPGLKAAEDRLTLLFVAMLLVILSVNLC